MQIGKLGDIELINLARLPHWHFQIGGPVASVAAPLAEVYRRLAYNGKNPAHRML